MDYQPIKGGFLVRLFRNEKVTETLLAFIREQGIPGGSITGIGAIEKVTLGYFDQSKKQYAQREFDDVYEVISYIGNISYVNDEPFVHAHILLGDREFQPHAGHFFEGTVAVTMEVFLRITDDKILREKDDELQLNLLRLKSPK
jgi:predicted DNA-binding protein with PD1-like motif